MVRLILINLIFVLVFIFLISPNISKRADGLTITTNYASFYIPSSKPIKIYVFNPKPKELEEIIKETTGKLDSTLGIVVKNLSTGQQISVNADETFNSASLYKLSLMYAIYEKGQKGLLDISKEDIQNNLNQMITVSSNEAALYLVENYANWSEVTKSMHSLGLEKTDLNQNPTVTSPSDMAKLLELIAASPAMLDLLSKQRLNDRIPVRLPPATIVAHKTGELGDVRHDAGVIITPENNYILVLMSKDSENPESIKPEMAELSKKIHDFFTTQWANPPEIL